MADADDAVQDPQTSYDVVKPDLPTSVYNTYDATGHRRFKPGNPGRPTGAKGKVKKSLEEIVESFPDLDPVKLRMEQLQRYQAMLQADQWSYPQERLEVEKLLSAAVQDLMQYRHSKLKTVEHLGQLDIIHKLQQLDSLSDAELQVLLVEAEAMAKQLPPGQ